MALDISANGTKRVRPGRRLSLRQVVELQDIAFQAAKGLITDFQGTQEKEERARVASAISNLAKGWVSLQDAKREILGKPKAGVRKHAVEKKPKPKRYWEMPLPELEPIGSSGKPDEVQWEMREGPPGVFTQVVTKSPALAASDAAGAVAGSSSAPRPAPPPAPTSPANQPGLSPKPAPVPQPAVPPQQVYHPIRYGR